jgi:hypothetical protein
MNIFIFSKNRVSLKISLFPHSYLALLVDSSTLVSSLAGFPSKPFSVDLGVFPSSGSSLAGFPSKPLSVDLGVFPSSGSSLAGFPSKPLSVDLGFTPASASVLAGFPFFFSFFALLAFAFFPPLTLDFPLPPLDLLFLPPFAPFLEPFDFLLDP